MMCNMLKYFSRSKSSWKDKQNINIVFKTSISWQNTIKVTH